MESLESKLDRLSPEQRKGIEDFVDFLLTRSVPADIPPNTSCYPPQVLNVAPPPLGLIEPVHGEETLPVRAQDLVNDPAVQPRGDNAGSVPFQERGGGNDRITHDYMDTGQFEHQPSPSTEAVKMVRRKIITREEQEKPCHLLDWVD
jgi:hypothetical protein